MGRSFPLLRFYKNNLFGEDKLQKSVNIPLTKDWKEILDEVHENMAHEVTEVSEKILNTVIFNNALDHRKHSLVYFYNTVGKNA